MKNMPAVLIVLASLLCIFPAGAYAVPAPDVEREETPEGITYITAYSARGSRSEARHHYLEIEGFSVPDVFSQLNTRTSLSCSSQENTTGETTDTSGLGNSPWPNRR